MVGVLIKKQFTYFVARVLSTGKNGKRRSMGGMIGLAALLIFSTLCIAFAFVGIGELFCSVLLPDNGWIYFVLFGGMTFILGVFGSAVTTFSTLYQAKDNELLLSMPIKPGAILLSRMISVYLLGLLYESIAMIPGIIVYGINMNTLYGISVNLMYPFIMWLAMSFVILAFSCLMGWIVALAAGRIKNKTPITVILTLVLVGAIYYFQFNSQQLLTKLVEKGAEIGEKVRKYVYPLYAFGCGSAGETVPMLVFLAIAIILCVLTYLILSCTFSKITTRNVGFKKAVYKEKEVKAGNEKSALLKKEFRHYLASPAYILNSGLGGIVMLLGSVALILFNADMQTVLSELEMSSAFDFSEMKVILIAGVIGAVASMNMLTAPSISLEGKSFWMLKVLPVSPIEVLRAKLKMHLILTTIPAVLLVLIGGILLGLPYYAIVLVCVFSVVYIILHGQIGLIANLKFPNLNWPNETVAVKTGAPVLIAMFGGWGETAVIVGLYFLIGNALSAISYLTLISVILAVVIYLCNNWIVKKGTGVFMEIN